MLSQPTELLDQERGWPLESRVVPSLGSCLLYSLEAQLPHLGWPADNIFLHPSFAIEVTSGKVMIGPRVDIVGE